MNDDAALSNDFRRSASRGPQYPAFGLREAVQKVQVIWDAEKRNPAPFPVLAGHWKFSVKSSGARTCIATVMRFRLLERKVEDYRLSDLALSILLGGDNKPEALREAALSPKLYADLWQRYSTDMPSEQSLTHRLVIEGYHASSVPSIIKDWKDTIEFAGLKKGDARSDEAVEPDSVADDLEQEQERTSSVVLPPVTAARRLPPQPQGVNPSLRYLPIPLAIGDAHIPMGMTEPDFELLVQSLQLWKPRLVEMIRPEHPQSRPDQSPL